MAAQGHMWTAPWQELSDVACDASISTILNSYPPEMRCSRAKAKSVRHAVAVLFSKSRGRYEWQGLLLEPQALAEVLAAVASFL